MKPKPYALTLMLALCLISSASQADEVPMIVKTQAGSQLIVGGKPFLILGGELGNSSAGTAGQADTILPAVAKLNVNTVLMPVAWEQIEPVEGQFDFTILDHWIEVAQRQHLHLVLLWFGSWKNAFSDYAPVWVKRNTTRFPRAISSSGSQLEILSTLGTETLKADSRAFLKLMEHIRDIDARQQTVLMVQVENEVGYLGSGRDRSEPANRLFNSPVPLDLIHNLEKRKGSLSAELSDNFNPRGATWKEVFGNASNEVFMAWNYARFIQKIAASGKKAYPLPMYLNAQLPAPFERAGEYPSGGPHPYYLDIYRATAPAIDFYSPDIYWPNFEYWIQRYKITANPIFVPESRLDAAPFNALYAFGQAGAFGFSVFGIDSVAKTEGQTAEEPNIAQTYGELIKLSDTLIPAQADGKSVGLVLHANSSRPTQTVALGGYLMQAALSRSWPAKTLLANDGAMIVVQKTENEFYVLGQGLTVTFSRDPDIDDRLAGIESIEEVDKIDDRWTTLRRLNGDQSNQGRQLTLNPSGPHIYRVVLYSVARTYKTP